MVSDIGDIEFNILSMISSAVMIVDACMLNSVFGDTAHDLFGAIDIANRKWNENGESSEMVTRNKAFMNNDAFSTTISKCLCNDLPAGKFANEFSSEYE